MNPVTGNSPEYDTARTWAMGAHLAGIANFVFPFSGLIGAIVVYSLRRSDPSFVRENARNALNMQITLTAFNAAVIVVALVLFFAIFATAVASSGPSHQHDATPAGIPWEFAGYFGCFAVLILVNAGMTIWYCLGARAAYLGHVFRYAIAVPFVRPESAVPSLSH
jgi:uncharacterized Tic20 family protein